MSSTQDWLPAVIATAAGLGVAYIALSQATRACEDAEQVHKGPQRPLPVKSGRTKPLFSAPRGGQSSQRNSKATTPVAAASASAAAAGGPATSSKVATTDPSSSCSTDAESTVRGLEQSKQCAHCHKSPASEDALHRCSRCKHVYYCNQTCQKAAWPQHKKSCRRSSVGTSSSSSSATGSPTAAQQNGAANGHQQHQRQSPDPQRSPDAASVMDVLKHYLQQHSASQDDPLQQQFEQAVLLYVRQEHRTAVAQLQAVQQAAEQQGQFALAGDACKWMGHSFSKLGDSGKAAAAFASGCDLAVQSGNQKLQVDCLSGMGAMYRDCGQLSAAEGFLRQALKVAEVLGDDVVRAACLTHLGTVLIASDAPAAIKHLEEAVQLREDQVIQLHDEGKRGSALATAIMEHAGSLVSLAGAYYCCQRYTDAADAYSKSLAVFEMIEDAEKMAKCLINLANLHELQMPGTSARSHAAEQRQRLYQLASQQLGRDVSSTCSICCEPIDPLQPTSGEEQQLLVLACLHCFHFKCWETWKEKQSTCPSCKQPMPLGQQH